jgi:hypothetical protein
MYTGMGWVCCKNGWYKDNKEVTGRQARKREVKGKLH